MTRPVEPQQTLEEQRRRALERMSMDYPIVLERQPDEKTTPADM